MNLWIRNLRFSTKLLAIMVAGFFPLALLAGLYLSQEQQHIHGAQSELSGLERLQNLQELLVPLSAHEISSIAVATGEGTADKLRVAADDVTRIMAQQEQIDQRVAPKQDDESYWSAVKAAWSALSTGSTASPTDIVGMHTLLRRRIFEYRDHIAAESRLLLDDDPLKHFLIDATVMQIPGYEGYLTQMRAHAASVAAVGKATPSDLESITRDRVLAQSGLDLIAADIGFAAESGADGGLSRGDA